jgi:SAM-dependent methyltransferase
MHDTASATGKAFFEVYGHPGCSILDVGSCDVNGTLRPFAPRRARYTGVDREPGPGVDIVNDNPYKLPFRAQRFDLVVSTSCLEHDRMFWVTFAEMARVVKAGGFVYISVPVNGPVHRHPMDCWRFYPDAYFGLVDWARSRRQPLCGIETFLVPPRADVWTDFVAVFGKVPVPKRGLMRPLFPEAINP